MPQEQRGPFGLRRLCAMLGASLNPQGFGRFVWRRAVSEWARSEDPTSSEHVPGPIGTAGVNWGFTLCWVLGQACHILILSFNSHSNIISAHFHLQPILLWFLSYINT